MTKRITRTDYEARLSRVSTYIYEHLDEPVDLLKLAEIANLSPYHWHRIYGAVYGETIAGTTKRLRLHRAAGYLVHTSLPVAEIAERSGYPNLQSFTRIFKSAFGLPPAQYRENGSHNQFSNATRREGDSTFEVSIRQLPILSAVTVEHHGPYMDIGLAFDQLFRHFATHGLLNEGTRTMGIFYDDPSAIEASALRSRAAIIYDGDDTMPFARTEVRAGDYAVLRHQGPYANMPNAYQWLFGNWLVNSGREADDAPIVEEYLNNPRDTPPTELLTDLHLPLRAIA